MKNRDVIVIINNFQNAISIHIIKKPYGNIHLLNIQLTHSMP